MRHPHDNPVMQGVPALISVVDDDESVRESLPDLLRECGYVVEAFASAQHLLASDSIGRTCCLILDIGMPGMSGPELWEELKRRGHDIPIIFITAQSDDALRGRLLAQGAAGCLFKPFSESDLLGALRAALPVR